VEAQLQQLPGLLVEQGLAWITCNNQEISKCMLSTRSVHAKPDCGVSQLPPSSGSCQSTTGPSLGRFQHQMLLEG
jgi:hypothetical protein